MVDGVMPSTKEKKMGFSDIALAYVNMLWSQFQFDISVFSQVWLYAWILVPALFYLMFFFLKWAVLTAPLWIPFAMVAKQFNHDKKNNES